MLSWVWFEPTTSGARGKLCNNNIVKEYRSYHIGLKGVITECSRFDNDSVAGLSADRVKRLGPPRTSTETIPLIYCLSHKSQSTTAHLHDQ